MPAIFSWRFLCALDLACLICAVLCIFKIITTRRIRLWGNRYSLPPGPRGYPIFGNVFDMPGPKTQVGRIFAEWGKIYGGICSAKVFGQTFIILNDERAIHCLLHTKGANYADRPQTTMLKLGGFGLITTLMPYHEELKEHRKLMAQSIGTPQSIKKFWPNADHQSLLLLRRILENPCDLDQAIKRSTGSAVLSVAYGYSINEEGGDELLEVTDHVTALFGETLTPGRFLVDTLPFLQYLPKWFPPCRGFKEFAAESRIYVDKLIELPMKFIREELDHLPPCYVSDLMTDPRSQNKMYSIASSAANFYGAGTDTMKSAVLCYFLAMTIHPHIQQRLHDEIDTIVGCDRFPTFQDRSSLPYLQAVFKECCRWFPALPIGVLHQASCDDTYDGYFIPKGSIVVANSWKLLHDPAIYSDPFIFNPDRFLGSNPEKDPFLFCFGFGRRICPGLHLADAVVWSYLAKSAAALHISKAIGPDGKEITPVCDQTVGVVSQPLPFECQISPRHSLVHRWIDEALQTNL